MMTSGDIPDLKANILLYLDPDYKYHRIIFDSMTFVNNHGHISHDFYNEAWIDVANQQGA